MSANLLRIDPWNLQWQNSDGFVGISAAIPSMQVQFQATLDCTVPKLGIVGSSVQILNSDALVYTANGSDRTYTGFARGPFLDGQSYMNVAHVLISSMVTFVELRTGVLWANSDPPKDQWGVPRFAVEARMGVTFTAQTIYYTQKWSAAVGGWGPIGSPAAYSSPQIAYTQTSDPSGLDQMSAHFNCSGTGIEMPPGAGRDWAWGNWTRYQIDPPPGTPPPVAPPATGTKAAAPIST